MAESYEKIFLQDLKLWNHLSSDDVLSSLKLILAPWSENDYNTDITKTWITKFDLLSMQLEDNKSNLKHILFNVLLSKTNFESILEIDKDNSIWDRFSVMIVDALSPEMANRWASKIKQWEFNWIDFVRRVRLIDYCISTDISLFTIDELLSLWPSNESIKNKIAFIWLINEYDLDLWFQKIIEILWSEDIWEEDIDTIFLITEIFGNKHYRNIIKEKFRDKFTTSTQNDFLSYESAFNK